MTITIFSSMGNMGSGLGAVRLMLCCNMSTIVHNKLFSISIFLDFRKAFDTVNKKIMLHKLKSLGFRGTVNYYFRDYLSNRKTYVNINILTAKIRLHQWSVTASWLLSLYINDMNRVSAQL